VIMVNDEYFGNVTPEKVRELVKKMRGDAR